MATWRSRSASTSRSRGKSPTKVGPRASGPGARPLPGRAPASTRRDTGGREGELVDGWDSKVEGDNY